MTAVALRRRTSVDMSAWLTDAAPMLDAWLTDWNPDPAYIRTAYANAAAMRPAYGLSANRTRLTVLTRPTDRKFSNIKIGKNDRATISLTTSAFRSAIVDGVTLNTCPNAGYCARVCVLGHGRGSFDSVKAARAWRTAWLYADPLGFVAVLRHEIMQAADATPAGLLGRFNVNSDLPWHLLPALFADVDIAAYDYTKDPDVLTGDGWYVGGKYRRVYSVNERTDDVAAAAFLHNGGTVAMVTRRLKGQPVSDLRSLGGYYFEVVDGDKTDNRYDDPAGSIIDLYAKGRARQAGGRFVRK